MGRPRILDRDTDREKAIGKRLAEMRVFLGYTQPFVAKRLNITRARLASYESGRAPVKASFGLAFCRKFGVNERWLVNGVHPRHPCLFYAHHFLGDDLINPAELLSQYYDHYYAGKEHEVLDLVGINSIFLKGIEKEEEEQEHIRTAFKCILDDSAKFIPKKHLKEYCLAVLRFCATYLNDSGIKIYDHPFRKKTEKSNKSP